MPDDCQLLTYTLEITLNYFGDLSFFDSPVWFCEKEKRYTDQRTAAEADKLPLREVKEKFGFDAC